MWITCGYPVYTKGKNVDNSIKLRLEKIEAALETALNKNYTSDWQFNSFGNLSEYVTAEHLNNLILPNKNLIDLGGKRWRPLLMVLCYELFAKDHKAIDEKLIYSLTPLVEFVHTASLIQDDVEDSADLRRGKPAAHITYGLDTAINASSWLYFEAPVCINNPEISDEFKLKLYQLFTKELRRLHLGQAMDIYWHRNKNIFPSIDEYNQMVRCKTGTLASLAAQVGVTAGGAEEKEAVSFGEIAANIGVGFQIIDDVINLTTGNAGKKRGDDIVEGKKSLPVLIHIEENPLDKEKISLYFDKAGKEGIDSTAVEDCIHLLETSNCIQKAAAEGSKLIYENCKKFNNSQLITDLFTSMIPEKFR